MLANEIVRLDKRQHDLKSFDCGTPSITQYLHRYAIKNMGLNLSSTFVLPFDGTSSTGSDKQKIAGFYTLANLTVAAGEVPVDKALPRYPVPVVLLAQLGIDKSLQRQGLGSKLLIAALRHAYKVCTNE
ncbi:GNAT family N-acetyltransferase, partial [bacterium AH-315-K03]|nr:GNAT family N-acetyltransferase [bacterium AH-315-K03]